MVFTVATSHVPGQFRILSGRAQLHLFLGLAVGVMSFGQQLANKAHAVHTKWVEETLRDFMQHCEAAAEKGEYEAYIESELPPSLAREWVISLLNDRLSALGFSYADAAVKQDWDYDENCWLDTDQAEISALWDMDPTVPDKTNTAPQGIKGTCPICRESRHLVALTPCGHGVPIVPINRASPVPYVP